MCKYGYSLKPGSFNMWLWDSGDTQTIKINRWEQTGVWIETKQTKTTTQTKNPTGFKEPLLSFPNGWSSSCAETGVNASYQMLIWKRKKSLFGYSLILKL